MPVDSHIVWDCPGCNGSNTFYLSSDVNGDGNDIHIDSGTPTGQSAVSAGTYPNVHTIITGHWSFKIVPG